MMNVETAEVKTRSGIMIKKLLTCCFSITANGLGLADVGGFEIQMFKLSTNVK